MVVSVVTNGYSDDVNHTEADDSGVFLRIAGLGGGIIALHYSFDNITWHLARYFRLSLTKQFRIGFLAQSPTGGGLRTTFSNIHYEERLLLELRDGS